MARTIGMATARIAEANRELIERTLMQPGDTERDLALRFAGAAEHMLPIFEPTLALRPTGPPARADRRDVIGTADLASGEIGAPSRCRSASPTWSSLPARRGDRAGGAGLVAGRLEEMATGVAEPPVRLVKTIGDAAMLVSVEVEAMTAAALRLVEASEGEGEEFPFLRAGVARGPSSPRRAITTAVRSTSPVASPAPPSPAASSSTVPRRWRRRRLRLLLRRRAQAEGLRSSHQALPRPQQACARR